MSSDDFVILAGATVQPVRCLAVQPGVVDFPARCVGRRGHFGKHNSVASYMGIQVCPTYWDNDDD